MGIVEYTRTEEAKATPSRNVYSAEVAKAPSWGGDSAEVAPFFLCRQVTTWASSQTCKGVDPGQLTAMDPSSSTTEPCVQVGQMARV